MISAISTFRSLMSHPAGTLPRRRYLLATELNVSSEMIRGDSGDGIDVDLSPRCKEVLGP